MSTLHSMKKEIKKNNLKFAPDMYTHPMGSLIISAYILSPDKPDTAEINKTWRKICKKPEKYVNFWIDDKDFIDKSLALFNMKKPEEFPIAFVQSDFNALFFPYIEGHLLPLREDGIFPQTAVKGKIYPIDFTNKTDGEVMPNREEEKDA